MPAAQEASVSISGGSVAVGIQSNGAGAFASASFSITGQTTGKITIAPFTTSLQPGTYTGVIVVRGCGDQFCSSGDVAGSPVNLNVSYTVRAQTGLRASPPSLSFTQVKGGTAPVAQTLGLSDTANASYAWTASIQYQAGQATGWLNINGGATASGASLPDSLSVSVNPTTTVGTLNAVIHLTGNGKTLDVPVSYALNEPTLTRAPDQLTFSAAANGTAPNSQTVNLATQGSLPLDYTTSIVYTGGPQTGWLNKPPNGTAPGDVAVSVNTTILSQGLYTATLTFATATQMVSVDVTYTVVTSSITFTPGSASFAVGPSSTATALSQTVGVGSTGTAFSWTAASNQPWVTISPTSGTTGSSVTLSLDPAQLDTLDPGQLSAAITFNYIAPGGVGATSTPLSVTLNLALPKISWVSPYVALSGTSSEVILRGKGFNVLGVPLDFGGTSVPATDYTVVSDTEVRVVPPAFAAGPPRRIKFVNSLGNPSVVRSTADLVVVDVPVFGLKSLTYPDTGPRTVRRISYDAERKQLLLAVSFTPTAPDLNTFGALYRYTFNGTDWADPPEVLPVGGLHDLTLSPDGRKLLVLSGKSVTPYDPVSLTPGTSVSAPLLGSDFFEGFAMANDGNAVLTSSTFDAYRYSVADAALTKFTGVFFSLPQLGASANGSRIVVVQNGGSQPAYQYDASTGTLAATSRFSNDSFPAPSLTRNAAKILLGGSLIYDSSYNQLGATPPIASTVSAVISPDGTRSYAHWDGITHAYDLTQPSLPTFPEIATVTTTPSPGTNPRMTISPDGKTLFIAGDSGIVVMPAPQ